MENPLLVGGKKFDLRLYYLVTNYRPLKVWKSSKGFARFCTEKYDNDNTDDLYLHLTNVHLQKQSSKYNEIHGGKWELKNLLFYIEMNYGRKKAKKMKEEIDYVVLAALKSVQVRNSA